MSVFAVDIGVVVKWFVPEIHTDMARTLTLPYEYDLRRSASPKPSKGAMMRNDAGSVLVREDAGNFRAEEEHLGGVVHPHE